ncbi:MAG TPA: phosphotransferase, partial [Actinotalea sp.]|nr:phosphotransferase [Actinotalea sp.]
MTQARLVQAPGPRNGGDPAQAHGDQFPHWADLPVRALPHRGTDHAMFRLGEDLAVRLPRIGWARECVDREWEWQRRIAPLLGWESPLPLAQGEPGHGYPWRWSVVRWVRGEPPTGPDPALAADVARLL